MKGLVRGILVPEHQDTQFMCILHLDGFLA